MAQQPDLLAALVVFCVVTLFTPGPNNIMLMSSGLNYGFRRALPHLFGVALGFTVMVLAVGLGLGAAFTAFPLLYLILKYAGATYLIYLAWRIALAQPPSADGTDSRGRPITFFEAALFQWVNPKAWVMALSAISAYGAIATFPANVAVTAAIFGTLGLASSGTWVGFGQFLQRLIENPRALRAVNVAMALLLVASLYPVLAEGLG